MDTPNPTQATPSEGVGREYFGGVLYKSLNNRVINLILILLVFLMICSPAVENGCRNGIHH